MIKAYEPLHHKYRPKTFDELVGQTPIASTLKQALISDRISPAYLFSGPRGTGKTSSARIFAKSLNCLSYEKATTDPCGKCELCKGINSGNALDVIEIDAASNTGVENIRELIERSRFAPAKARWKVYVIDECHMLSTAAFNALLKTLEEPPPQVVFILATTDPQRVLPTIISRCMRFDFRRIGLDHLEDHLKNIARKEGILINEDALLLIAKHSQGGLRDAESLLDQVSLLPPPITQPNVINLIGCVSEEELIELARALINKDAGSILNLCNNLINNGKEPIAILHGIASILRDLVVIKVAENENNLCNLSKENSMILKNLANSIELDIIINLQAKLKGSENYLRNSNQPKLWLEINLLGMLSDENLTQNNIIEKSKLDIKDSDQVNKNEQFYNQDNTSIKKDLIKTTTHNKYKSNDNLNLDQIWEKVISMLELPSTKMLLSQQAKLINLNSDTAEISISDKWINMIQTRKNLIENAFQKAVGSTIKIILIQQKNEISQKNKRDLIKTQKESQNIVKNISEKKVTDVEVQTKMQKKDNVEIDTIDNQAKQFADFFNGEIVNLE